MGKETGDTAACLRPGSTTRLTQLELAWLELTRKAAIATKKKKKGGKL